MGGHDGDGAGDAAVPRRRVPALPRWARLDPGGILVGLIGVALLSSLISGILAHPRIFRDAFHLRLGGSKRLQEADFHNRLGVWALPFHIIISLTGAFLGLTTIIVGVLGMAKAFETLRGPQRPWPSPPKK